MKHSVNFPIYRGCTEEYGSPGGLLAACRELGLDGIEPIWGDEDYADTLPQGLVTGYHLLFWPDWLDFWLGDEDALRRKFGSREVWTAYYGGSTREALLRQYRADMARAADLGAAYVVMHVSDVSIEEGYTYRWLHSSRAVIDASIDLLNRLTEGTRWPFRILLENQWWPGLTFTDPALTQRLLRGVRFPDTGLLLDTGHLLNTNLSLRTEREGVAYLAQMLARHGSLSRRISGVHLHQSLSGDYVQTHIGRLPAALPQDYWERYAYSYSHILEIDRHLPWTDPGIAALIRRIAPDFVTHELTASDRSSREAAVALQLGTLRRGGLI